MWTLLKQNWIKSVKDVRLSVVQLEKYKKLAVKSVVKLDIFLKIGGTYYRTAKKTLEEVQYFRTGTRK